MQESTLRAALAAQQLWASVRDRVADDRGDGVLGWLIGVVVVALAAVALWTAWDTIFQREVARLEGIGSVG